MRTRVSKVMIMMLAMVMMFGGVTGWDITGEGKAIAAVSDDFGGAGTSDDPFQIGTADELNKVRNHLETGVYFKLTADIGLSSYSSGEGWLPISEGFSGSLDGNGFKIMNLTINRPTTDFIGLFGRSESGSEFRHIVLENINVQGKNNVGGLVGQNEGSISNSCVTGTGNVHGEVRVGGLVGANYYWGTISNSFYDSS